MVKDELKRAQSLNKQSFGLIIGFSLQYILGISDSLFINFPENAPESQEWAFAWKQIPVALHIVLGLFLTIGSIALFISAIRAKEKRWIIASSIGMVVTLITTYAGSAFVGSQSDVFSYIMALGFIVTLFAYIWGIFSTTKQLQSSL